MPDDRVTTVDAPVPAPASAAHAARARMRCVMIVNPYSSGLTAARERTIVQRLREHVDLDIVRTERSNHAPRLAADIVDSGTCDVIVACGGDGTLNEIVNGMHLDHGTAENRPRVAIVPAGGTNVAARGLGYVNHPVRALDQVVAGIVDGTSRTIAVGQVDERLFLFASGVGLDAEIVKRMEQRRSGRRPSDAAHLGAIFSIYATSRFSLHDRMTITVDGTDEQLRSALLFVGNATPMTYIGRRPVHYLPDARFEGGLDILAPRRASCLFATRSSMQAMGVGLRGRRLVSDESGQVRSDIPGFTVECDEPQPVQVDGEYLGDRTHLRYAALSDALRVVA